MKNYTIMLTGANGQLGSDIKTALEKNGHQVFGYTHEDAELSDFSKWEKWISEICPDIFINTAAFHQVDQCEENLEKALTINCDAPAQLAKLCHKKNVYFIHFSTDYVFDGKKNAPYSEKDLANPVNNYGISKLRGEEAILANNPAALVIRISAIYGINPCRAKNGLNFVQLMLKKARQHEAIKVVANEFVSPTSTQSIAEKLLEIFPKTISGILHLSSEGQCSWYEFAKAIFDYKQIPANLSPAFSSDFPAKTPRPAYSVMENTVLKQNNITDMPHWKSALHRYLQFTE